MSSLETAGRGPPRRASAKTVMAKFRSQLNGLMDCIEETKTRYIRCIKPNTENIPGKLNHRETMNQLESAGLVTAIQISRETFPNRLPYDVIWERFECLDNEYQACRPSFDQLTQDVLKNNVENLLKSLLLKPFTRSDGARVPSFSCGRTKVYFRTGALEHLESDRMEYYSFYAAKIGNWYRAAIAKLKFVRIKNLAIALQARARKHIVRNRYKSIRQAVVTVQSMCRMVCARNSFALLQKSATEIQTMQRMVSSRQKFRGALVSIIFLQSAFRATILKVRYSRIQTSIIKIQSSWRGSVARGATVELIKKRSKEYDYATQIQSWYRCQSSRIKTKLYTQGRFRFQNFTGVDHNQTRALSSPVANEIQMSKVDLNQTAKDTEELQQLRDEVATLKNRNIGLRSEVQEYNEEMTMVLQRNISLEQEHNLQRNTHKIQLEVLANSVKEEMHLLQQQKEHQDTALVSIQDHFAKISQEKVQKESELADVKVVMKSLECNYDTARDNLNVYEARISSLDEEVETREARIEEMGTFNSSMKVQIHDKDILSIELQGRISSLERDNDAMDSELKNSYDEVNTARGRFKDLQIEAEEMNNELEISCGEVNTLKSHIGILENKADVMDSELEAAHSEINSLKTQVLALFKKIEMRDGELKSSVTRINSLEDSNTKLKIDIEHSEGKSQTLTSSFKAQVLSLKESIESQQNTIETFKEAQLSGEVECQTLEGRVLKLQQKNQSCEDAATMYQQMIADLENETKEISVSSRANLMRSIEAENDVSSLSQEVKNHVRKVQDLEGRNSSLMKTITALEGEGGDLTEQLGSIVMEKKSLCVKIEQSTAKEAELKNNVKTLISERDDLDTKVSELQDEIGTIRETLTEEKNINRERAVEVQNGILHEIVNTKRNDHDEEFESLREQLEISLNHNSLMSREFEELETTKVVLVNHVQLLMKASKSAATRTQSLLDTNKTCLAEMSKLKIENTQIRDRDQLISPSNTKYERMVYDRDIEITELKEQLADALRGRERFAQIVDKKIQQDRDTMLSEIHDLKAKLRSAQQKSDDYNQKIINVLQTAHSTREAEVRKLRKEVKRLTQDLERASSATSISLSSISLRNRFEQTRGYLQVFQGERQRKLFELLNSLKTVSVQNGSASFRENLLPTIISFMEELCKAEEVESTHILSTFDETTYDANHEQFP